MEGGASPGLTAGKDRHNYRQFELNSQGQTAMERKKLTKARKSNKNVSTHTLEKPRTAKRVPIEKFAVRLRRRMTSPEKVLYRALQVSLQGYAQRPWPQHIIGPYIADFIIAGAYVVVEVDGRTHDSEKAQQYDCRRETYMRNIGFTTLRFTNSQVMRECDKIVAQILEACTLTPAGEDNTRIVKCPPGNARYSGKYIDFSRRPERKVITALSSFAAVRVCNAS